MRYLIICDTVYYTKYYDYDNNYCEGMVIVDTLKQLFTTNGIDWLAIELDHL